MCFYDKSKLKYSYEFDDNWIDKQRNKIEGDTVFILCDFFCKKVYDLKFRRDKLLNYCRKFEKSIGITNVICISETELIHKLKLSKLYKKSESKPISQKLIEKEIERRKSLYNPNKVTIDSERLNQFAKRAVSLSETEKMVDNEISKLTFQQLTKLR